MIYNPNYVEREKSLYERRKEAEEKRNRLKHNKTCEKNRLKRKSKKR